jgi:hypothetical protein
VHLQKDIHLELLEIKDIQVVDIERDTIEFRKAISLIESNVDADVIVLSSKKIQSIMNDAQSIE